MASFLLEQTEKKSAGEEVLSASAEEVPALIVSVAEDVILKVLEPVLNFKPAWFGTMNEPETLPLESVSNVPELPSG